MQSTRSIIKREAWAAGTMIVLGLGAIAQASTYNIGSLARMGPGMFPAILGVLPIAFGLGLEIFHHETTINAPSTQWWISLSSAIVFGLSFATVLTLIVTPSMLMVFTRDKVRPGARRSWWSRLFRRRVQEEAGPAAEAVHPAE